MLKFTAKIPVFVSILLTSLQAAAGLVASLYDVEIPVTSESAQVRNLAFEQGLDQVFVRISGDSIIMDKLKRPPASRYIKQFSYEPLAAVTANDITNAATNAMTNEQGEVLTHRLKIQYNGSLMEKYLLENGFPVWGQYRSDVIVWLAVRDGRNQYVLKQDDQSLLKAAASEALVRRGVPVRWPLYDAKDRSVLTVADIRGGFGEPVIKASQRYATDTALTGSLIWNGRTWQSGWSLFVSGEIRHWNLDGTDHKQLINRAIDQAADFLGAVLAVHNAANDQQAVSIQIVIEAVNSIEKYRYVENYLSGLSAVTQVTPVKANGQSAVFKVTLRSNEEDFHNLIKHDAQLVEVRPPQTRTMPAATAQTGIRQDSPAQPVSLMMPENNTGKSGEKDNADNALANSETETEKTEAAVPQPVIPQQVLLQRQIPIYYYRLNQR